MSIETVELTPEDRAIIQKQLQRVIYWAVKDGIAYTSDAKDHLNAVICHAMLDYLEPDPQPPFLFADGPVRLSGIVTV